ncbi:MAG: four helix bundle protein [Nitrospiraceae bacterium]
MMSVEQKKKEANDGQHLRVRTKQFALEIIRLYASLPKRTEALVLGKQILRSGTSVGAHYREAQRARSNAEFISKFEGGMQELEETLYWLELIEESGIVVVDQVATLQKEANEIMAIMVASVKTAKGVS